MLNILTKFKVELQVKYIGENFHERLQFALACTDDVTVSKLNFIFSIHTSLLIFSRCTDLRKPANLFGYLSRQGLLSAQWKVQMFH